MLSWDLCLGCFQIPSLCWRFYYFSFDNLNIKQWEAWVRAGNVTVIYKNEDYYFFLLLFFTFLYRKFLSRDRYITHSVHNVWSYLRFIMIIIYHNLLILFVVKSVGTSVLKNLQSINRIMWIHPCHCIKRCHRSKRPMAPFNAPSEKIILL